MSAGKTDCELPPGLRLRFFGAFEAARGEIPLPRTRTRKEVWLLALLACRHLQPVDRSWLAGTLWPDSPEARAAAYLRTSLYDLRRVLGSDASRLTAPTPRTVCLDLTGAAVDLREFDLLVARADPASLERAVALYRGPLLEGCAEDWVQGERESRHQACLQALETLALESAAADDAREAARLLYRAIGLDPLRESAHQGLMQALARCGDYAAVDREYRGLRHALLEQVNAEPSEETRALYRRLRAESRAPASHREIPSSRSPRRRLPCPLSSLVGRGPELREVSALLRQTRLVTLTGIGGVGKTRLGIAVAEALCAEFTDGVWFVDLAPLADAVDLARAVAEVFGVREERDRSLLETLGSFLGERSLLVVLDNCEHLVEACAGLAAALLSRCPHLRLLATSRQPLGLAGEAVWHVPSLEVPPAAPLFDSVPEKQWEARLSRLQRCAAVELFTERARCANPRIALTSESIELVAQICRRLEGIPLALELAAAHVRSASLSEIAIRLDDQYGLLTRGSPALPRHQTLRAAMDWSYRLLTEPERALLRRLAVFAGGWSLEAAEAVCGSVGVWVCGSGETPTHPHTHTPIPPDELLDLLSRLVDKSLVLYDPVGERYRLLETVREYARERLAQSDEEPAVRRLHRDYFRGLAEELERRQSDVERLDGLDALETDLENLRAALSWSLEEEPAAGLRMALALHWLWKWRSRLAEGCAWVERFLAPQSALAGELRSAASVALGMWSEWQGNLDAAAGWYRQGLALAHAAGSTGDAAFALSGLGTVCYQQRDYAQAITHLEASAALYRSAGWDGGSLRVRTLLGTIQHQSGNDEQARAILEECLALARRIGDDRNVAGALDVLGDIARDEGDLPAARDLYTEKLAVARARSIHEVVIQALNDLGRLARLMGDHATAAARIEEALRVARQVGSPVLQTFCLNHLAQVAYGARDLERLRDLSRESLELSWVAQEMGRVIPALHRLAALAAAREEPARAVRLLAVAARLEGSHGPVHFSEEVELRAEVMALTRGAIDESGFLTAWSEGAATPVEEAVTDALRWARSHPRAAGSAPSRTVRGKTAVG